MTTFIQAKQRTKSNFKKKEKRLDAVYIANFKKRETSITNVKNVKLYVFENIYMLILFLIQEKCFTKVCTGETKTEKVLKCL